MKAVSNFDDKIDVDTRYGPVVPEGIESRVTKMVKKLSNWQNYPDFKQELHHMRSSIKNSISLTKSPPSLLKSKSIQNKRRSIL